MQGRKDWFLRALPYTVIALVVMFGLVGYNIALNQQRTSQLLARTEAAERVAFEQCRSDNDTRMLVADVLDIISAPPRPGESQAQYEGRQQVFEEAKDILVLTDCPQAPGPVNSLRIH